MMEGALDARCARNAPIFATVLLLTILPSCQAADYTVGGAGGSWNVPTASKINYTLWAFWNTYFVGDALYFRYAKGDHSVLEVNARDYQSCTNASPIAVYADGNSLVPLNRKGPYYFMCGTPDHCSMGQKFDIDVADIDHRAPPPAEDPRRVEGAGTPAPAIEKGLKTDGCSRRAPTSPKNSVASCWGCNCWRVTAGAVLVGAIVATSWL